MRKPLNSGKFSLPLYSCLRQGQHSYNRANGSTYSSGIGNQCESVGASLVSQCHYPQTNQAAEKVNNQPMHAW